MKGKVILALSLPLAALIVITSSVGLLTQGFYAKETPQWIAQSLGQDAIDLFIATPSLIVATIFAIKKNRIGELLWAGVNLYLVYTFLIYCFAVHFNQLFILYCFTLGLSVYSFAYFLVFYPKVSAKKWFEEKTPVRFIGIYFLLIAIVFSFAWLSDILPNIFNNKTPKTVSESGLLTNPVEVIDLSVLLPGIFVTGIFLLQEKISGFIMTPVLLTFFILMDLTISGISAAEKLAGLNNDHSIGIVMSMQAIFSFALLIIYFKNFKKST